MASSSEGPRVGSRVPALPEIALGACLVGLAVFTAIGAEADNLAGEREPAAWWEWLIVVAPAAPVAFRRVTPLSATTVTVAAQIAVWGIGLATLFFAPLIMIYTVCAEEGERGRRLGACSGIALCAMTLLGVFVAPDVTLDLLVFTGLASAMAYLFGTRAAQSRAVAVALAEELADLSSRARDGKLKLEEMQGGTFTVSSLGGIGGTAFTPIINPPEVAILGVSRSKQMPVWDGSAFVPRLMLPLSLSYDHRVIDGATGAQFLQLLRGFVENPLTIVL